jgi:cytochrome c biogenesis protein CcdA
MTHILALWYGLLAALGPCALGPNLAALAYLTHGQLEAPQVIKLGFAFSFGRFLLFLVLGSVVLLGVSTKPQLAEWLQTTMPKAQGPIFILFALAILGVIPAWVSKSDLGAHLLQRRGNSASPPIAFLLGIFSALAFCPSSAALFFAALMPLTLQSQAPSILLPAFFGLGSALPIVAGSMVLSRGLTLMGRWLRWAKSIDRTSRWITGAAFLFVGGYDIWKHLIRPSLE